MPPSPTLPLRGSRWQSESRSAPGRKVREKVADGDCEITARQWWFLQMVSWGVTANNRHVTAHVRLLWLGKLRSERKRERKNNGWQTLLRPARLRHRPTWPSGVLFSQSHAGISRPAVFAGSQGSDSQPALCSVFWREVHKSQVIKI